MMKYIVKGLAIVLLSSMFFACSNSVGGDSSGNNNNNGNNPTANPDNPTIPIVTNKLKVKFDFEGAKALAKLEENTSRSVTNVDNLGDLVKILEDGSMENAVTVGDGCYLSDIVAIYKSPVETSKDMFIVFNGDSYLGDDINVGQLICIHEDGSIADILKIDETTEYWNSHMSLKTDSVTFDAKGNVYFISSVNGDLIYQFNPKTNELTKMVAAVENTWYDKMQIDDEGKWIFVSGNRSYNSYFLRAIPVNNPNAFVNIYYSSNWSIDSNKWAYDDKNGMIYFIVNDGGKEGLFYATKTASFKDKTFYHRNVGEGVDVQYVFEDYGFYTGTFSWTSNVLNSSDNFDSNKAVEQILSWLPSYYDYQDSQNKRITLDNVDIRFDKWASVDNELAKIAKITKGKKNQDAFEALNTNEGRKLIWEVDRYNNGYFDSRNGQNGYSHDVLADILYIKDTDILLCESEDVIIEYSTSSGDDTVITGYDLFERYMNGNYKDSHAWYFQYYLVEAVDYEWINTWKFNSDFYDADENLDSTKVLEFFFNYCNVEGNKEFNLISFKNDESYSNLYTTLKNEEAIVWLSANVERMNSLRDLLMGENNYFPFMNFLSKTCFISETNQKAITWNCDKSGSIEYVYYNGEGAKLSKTSNGIYYEYYNTWGDNPYYYIVQIADSEGKFVELVNKLPLPAGKVVRSEKNKDRVVLQYSLMDNSGAETGFHHIYAVEMETGDVTNCFDNVPNRNSLEVVSFNTAGDMLYFSAVRGTSVENGIVNIVTNEYNPLTVQRKMVAVYTF